MARKNGDCMSEAPRHPTGLAIEIVAVLVVKTAALALYLADVLQRADRSVDAA